MPPYNTRMPKLLKRGERNAVLGIAVLFMLFYGLGWWFAGPVATVPALAVTTALLAALVIAATRRLRSALDEHLQQTQALLFLQEQLHADQPLPLLDRASLLPDAAATLAGLIRTHRPQLVLELGSGVSTLIAAYCLRHQGSGRIISLEHDPHYSALTHENLQRHGLEHIARVIDAPLETVTVRDEVHRWYDVRSLEAVDAQVDLLVVDGPPRRIQRLARYPALPLLIDRLADNAVILVDDANRADERETVRRWQTEFPGFRVTRIVSGEGTVVMQREGDVPHTVANDGTAVPR
jgi:predicted O-methyltransferase YrrM